MFVGGSEPDFIAEWASEVDVPVEGGGYSFKMNKLIVTACWLVS